MTKREDVNKSEILVHLECDPKKWEKAQNNAFAELLKNLEVKGFRKGKVPTSKAKQEIDQNAIWQKALESLNKDMGEEANKEITKKDKVIAGPFYRVDKMTKTELKLIFSYSLYPEINIKEYKNLDVKYKEEKATDEEVERELVNVRTRLTVWNIINEPIQNNLKAKFDFEGFINNKPFSGGKAENYELIIGSNKFIPGFEKEMIGMKKSEKKDIHVTFPNDYHDKEKAGKKAKFVVTVHEIYKKNVPEFNDNLAIEANVPNIKTLAALRVFIKKSIADAKIMNVRNLFRINALKIIKKDIKIEIPESLENQEIKKMIQQFEMNLKNQGITFQQYTKTNNITPQDLINKFKIEAKVRILDTFIFSEIANREKFKVTEDDCENQYKKISRIYSQEVDLIKKSISKEQLQIQILNDKVLDMLISSRKK